MNPPGLALYRLATGLAEPLLPLWLRARARRGKEDPARLDERLARAPVVRPEGPLVWLHGASVGESLSLSPLAQAMLRRRPELSLLVTAGTVTAAGLLPARSPAGAMHRYAPVDAPGAAARFMEAWRPDLAVFVESEVWPNLIQAAQERGTRLGLVSARLSAASLSRWGRAPDSARRLFDAFDRVMAQDDATAAGLAALGARDDGRLNLKLHAPPLPVDPARLETLRRAAAGRPVLLAASTHPGEDETVLQAFAALGGRPDRPRLVIAPRHPERGAAIAALAAGAGLPVSRQGAGEAFGGAEVHVADALGELGLWFSLARAALVGGGLAEGPGGHNPAEAARLGCPILSGQRVQNWAGVYAALAAADGFLPVADAASLAAAWAELLDHPDEAQARAERARAALAPPQGALDAAPKL